jgi:hypothetical protein
MSAPIPTLVFHLAATSDADESVDGGTARAQPIFFSPFLKRGPLAT